mmetsp:Transcript_15567/g.31960  ORF Transcript_15567/g.31960 Transcript_15567/m.31960 type:complete len:228 (-) Transcript_15567:815-1498(-)
MSLFLSPQPELRNAESSPTAIFEFPTDIQSSFPEDTRNKGWNSSSTAGFSLFGRTGVNEPVSYPAVAEEGNLFESILPFICDEVSNVVMAEKPLPKHSSTSLDLGSIGELQLDIGRTIATDFLKNHATDSEMGILSGEMVSLLLLFSCNNMKNLFVSFNNNLRLTTSPKGILKSRLRPRTSLETNFFATMTSFPTRTTSFTNKKLRRHPISLVRHRLRQPPKYHRHP